MPDPSQEIIDQTLTALRQSTPPERKVSPKSQFGMLGSTSESQYLEGLTYDRNPEYIKASNQGFLDSMGNAIAQVAVGVPLEVAEGVGYLGIGYGIDKARGTEEEFGNSFSNKMREWNEQFKTDVTPIYTTPEDQGFQPLNYKWWASNAPSIASAISLAIPAAGAIKGLGAAGKAMGMLNLAKKMGIGTAALEAGEAIGMAALSRHMEGMMEGMEVYNTLYEQAKQQGKTDIEARETAGSGASETYTKNWPLIIGDILQFGMAFKAFGAISRNAAEGIAMKSTLKEIGFSSATEAFEEGTQYVIGEEAKRRAAIASGLEKDDYSTYPDRLLNYATKGDFWTSAFFGALGGAAFAGAGTMMENKASAKQNVINETKSSALEKTLATLTKDPVAFAKSVDTDIARLSIAGIEAGRADMIERTLQSLKEGKFEGVTEEEQAVLKQNVDNAITDLKYLEEIYNGLFKDPTKKDVVANKQLTSFELVNRAEVRSNLRLQKQVKDIQSVMLDRIGTERQLDSSYLSLLQAETELNLLNNELKDKVNVDKEVIDDQINGLTKRIATIRDTIKTNYGVTDSDITNKLNINKSDLANATHPKVLFDLVVTQQNKDYDKLQTEKGRKEVLAELDKHTKREAEKEYKAIVDKINKDSSAAELIELRDAAKQLGKEKEFTEHYNKTILGIREVAPKFNKANIGPSLTQRFASSNMLKEKEVKELSDMAMKTGGIPETFEPQDIENLYRANPNFAVKVDDYYARAEASLKPPTKTNVKTTPITSNKPSPEEKKDTTKPKPEPIPTNRNAWNLQGVQFELETTFKDNAGGTYRKEGQLYFRDALPITEADYKTAQKLFAKFDTNNPAQSNLAKKINWKFLNQGGLPVGGTIHFEYDFEDQWNKDHKNSYESLFEGVYYIDGNSNNKQSSNRMVVGAVTAYRETDIYESPEAKVQLKSLRESLFKSVMGSGFKSGNMTLPVSTKVGAVFGGQPWNTSDYHNPMDVLNKSAGHQFILAIGVGYGHGNNRSVTLETNGHPVQNRLGNYKAEPGGVYMVLPTGSGDMYPYKLYTKFLKELPGMTKFVADNIRSLKEAKTNEEKKAIHEAIGELVYTKSINILEEKYYIDLSTNSESQMSAPIKDEDLEEFVGNLVVQVDVKRINKDTYNEDIANGEFITTDVNPYTYFHSAKVSLEPVTTSDPKINSTVAVVPENVKVADVTIAIPTKGKRISGIGSTEVILGKGKPSLVIDQVEEGSYTPLSPAEAETWLRKRVPQFDVNFTPNLIEMYKRGGSAAWGEFYGNTITLYHRAKKGTEYHEAFHGVFTSLLTADQQQQILNSGYTEEELADRFADYVEQQGVQEGTLKHEVQVFFKKLWDFILSIFANDIDINTLFFRINTGYYSNMPLVSLGTESKFKPIADPYRINRNVKMMNYIFFQALHEERDARGWAGKEDIDVLKDMGPNLNENVTKLYGKVYNGLLDALDVAEEKGDTKQYNELLDITSNLFLTDDNGVVTAKGQYYMESLKDLRRYGIAIRTSAQLSLAAHDAQLNEELYEINEEEDALEGWQVKAIHSNGKESLAFNVRRLLRQVTEHEIQGEEFVEKTDQFGFKRFLDFDEVYNYIERNVAGILDVDEMIGALEDLKWYRPELHGVLERLKSDSNLKSQFFSNFAKEHIPSYQILQETQRWMGYTGPESKAVVKTFNANRKNLYQLIIDDWNTNLTVPNRNQVTNAEGEINRIKALELLRRYDAIIDAIKKHRKPTLNESIALSNILLNFGIDVSPQTIQNEYISKSKMKGKSPYESYMTFVNGPKSLRTLINTIAGGVNPFKGERYEDASVTTARIVARNVANLHQDSFINIEGKQVYSYLLPTFINKKITELKEQSSRASIANNWWFKNNRWIQDLNAVANADLMDQFGVVLLDGLSMENKLPVKYFNMTEFQLDVTDLNMFDNNRNQSYGLYRVPILSDSSQAPYIRFKKYTDIEVIDAFYQLALSERDRITQSQGTNIKVKNWNEGVNNGGRYNFVTVFNNPEIDIANEEQAKAAIKQWLMEEYTTEQKRLQENGVLTKDGKFERGTISDDSRATPGLLRNYFLNKTLANAMMTQLFGVDLAFYKNHDDFQKRFAQVFKFTRMIDVNANWNGYTPGLTYKTVYVNDSIIKSELRDGIYKDLINKGYSEEYAKRVADSYNDINQTDAQTYHTIHRRRKIEIGLGQWNDEKEEIYKKIVSKKAADNIDEIFNPIKPFYFSHELLGDITVPVQNKNSEALLTHNLAKYSPTLKKLLDFMEKNDIDSVQFVSAVKVGEHGATTVDNIAKATVHELDNHYWGIQQETPEHHIDTENLFGSQVRKLIISDLPDDAKFGKYAKKEIVDLYQKLVAKNYTDSYNQLVERTNTIEKIQEILLDQVLERNLGPYYENSLRIVEGKFNIPLYHPIHARRFEQILNSVVRNGVVKQKINGGSFALMSNFGFTDKLQVKLKPDGGVDYMEVMLPPWTKKFFPRKPNGEVDLEAIAKDDPKILEMFGYRIPTEHKYSMKKLKVVGFTPDFMGGVAMLPAEITKIAGEDFDIDKMYVMIPNFEDKDGKLQAVKYDLSKIDELSKEQIDNALIDIINTIWSSSAVSDQITIPGGFDTLKRLSRDYSIVTKIGEQNAILPRTQMDFFTRNTNGSQLIGIAANHNAGHAVLQYTKIRFKEEVMLNGEKVKDLFNIKALDNKTLISRNLAEFLAAFVDNAKDPIAGDLNLNTFTFDTVAMLIRLGFDLKSAVRFITQPAIVAYTKEYYKLGGTRQAKKSAFANIKTNLIKGKTLLVDQKAYNLNTSTLKAPLIGDLSLYSQDDAIEQLKVLYTFDKYLEQADSLAKLTKATRSDTLGTRKTIAGNSKAIIDITRAKEDLNLENVTSLFEGDIYPIVQVGTNKGLIEPQSGLLSDHFPYDKVAYLELYKAIEENRGTELSEAEINHINNLTLVYYTSGFGFFNESEAGRREIVNKFPAKFSKLKEQNNIKEFELMKYLRYVPKETPDDIDRIEFVSSATISGEQREILTRSWEAMLASDDKAVSDVAKELVNYSFATNRLSFSYAGFSNLIPTTYLDKLYDPTLSINFRDYLYKLQEEAKHPELFTREFLDQFYRHDSKKYSSLVPKLNDKEDVVNKKAVFAKGDERGAVTSLIVKRDKIIFDKNGDVLSKYFKHFNNNRYHTYKFSGVTASGDYVYNLLQPLGYGSQVYELSRNTTSNSILAPNKLPKSTEKDYYTTVDEVTPGEELYQINMPKTLETKYGLVDHNGVYKSYGLAEQGERSTKAYRNLINDLARINNDLRGTGYKAVYGQQSIDGKLRFVGRIVDETDLPGGDVESLAPNNQLNDLLRDTMSKLGIKVEYYDELKTRTGLDVNGLADLTQKIIKISKKKERVDTLPEEVGHVAEAFNRGTAEHNRLMELVIFTPEYQQVKRDYAGVYGTDENKYKQEAIGQLIGKAIIKNQPYSNTLYAYIKRLWDKFLKVFENVNEIAFREEIENITGKIAEDILSGNVESWSTEIKIDGIFYQLGTKEEEKAKKVLEEGIDSINKKIKLYQERAQKTFTEREKAVLDKLLKEHNEGLYKKGLIDYTIHAKRELRKIEKRYSKMVEVPTTMEEQRETLKTLNQINNYVSGFKNTLNGIAESGVFSGNTAEMRNINRFIGETAALVNQLEKKYYEVGKPILATLLREFSTNPENKENKDKISNALDVLEKDITFTQRFLDQLSECDDSILNILDTMVKDAKHRGRLRTLDFTKEILRLKKNLEKAGIPTVMFMYERDFAGNLTGNIIDEYNNGEYDKRRSELFEKNPPPNEKDFKTPQEYKASLKLWKEKIGKWFEANTKEHPGKDKIIADKKEELAAKHPNNPTQAAREFNIWYAENVLTSTYFDFQAGQYIQNTKYRKELAVPNDSYRNTVWQDIQSNPAMKEYYDFVKKSIKDADFRLPEVYKLDNMAPQVRKDLFERMSFVDATGKRTFKSLKQIGSETKTALGEQFIKHENDLDYGLTDENNEPINFLPVRFTRKLKDPTNLSLDLTSNMIAYMYSVNDFSEMNRIIDTLEFAKDVVAEREVKTGRIDPVTMFKRDDKKGKDILKQGKESLAFKRLDDWMRMSVYGQASKEEGKLFGADIAKLADFVNKYTSLSSLALNIYSGISNATVGSAMIRMEAMAGEFIDNTDLAKAGLIYAQELPGTLANIGQRLESNKMELWNQYMDTLQNYDRDYRNVDAGRTTTFSRLMHLSSLYFLNHAGEHYIQSKMSLALAQNTKVKDAEGKEMNLWEAFDVVGDKIVLKPNLTKVAGKKSTHLFKKAEDGQPLTQRDIIRFINRQNFINKRMHGIYNNVDKSALQHYALGRLVTMFRKFIKPGWNRRFANGTWNEEGEVFTEGYYNTLGRFMKQLAKDLKEGQFTLVKNWDNLTDSEKANFFRLFTEWGYVIASITAAAVLTQMADDDDDNYALNLAAYEAYRMYSELRFYTSYTELWRIAKSPAAAVHQVEKLIKFTNFADWNKEVTRGKYDGLNRFQVGAIEIFPILGTYHDFRTPEEQLRFFTNSGVTIL